MALLGISESLGARGIQSDLRLGVVANAGVVLRLGSTSDYLRLASGSVTHVLDADVSLTGIEAADVIFGVEVRETQVDYPCLARPLAPGDTFQTDQLASGSDVGAITGAVVPGAELSVDPATGKIRQKQATDDVFFWLAPDGGNTFNTDGRIWVEVARLD